MSSVDDLKNVEELLNGVGKGKPEWVKGWFDKCPYCGCVDFEVDPGKFTPDVVTFKCPECHFSGTVSAPWELQDEKYDDGNIVFVDLDDDEWEE